MSSQLKLNDYLRILSPLQSDGSSSPRLGLQLLLLLRSFVSSISVIGLLIFQSFSSLDMPLIIIVYLLIAIVISVILGFWRLRSLGAVSEAELFGHLLLDVAFLVFLLLNTGGAANPLISYLLVLLAVAATLLSRRYVYTFAVGSIFLYSSFLLLDLFVNHEMAGTAGSMASGERMTFQIHLVGMWVIFLVSAILISVFITRMASAIQIREANLAEARETEIRNEQLVAIGTLSAGTAHALGTPLSTMAVLLTELDKMDVNELQKSDIKGDISLLREQVNRCKNSLNQLIRYYNKDNPEKEEQLRLMDFIGDIEDYITNIHPSAKVTFARDANCNPTVQSDLSFKHAVINIIENGIKAADSEVKVKFGIVEKEPELFQIIISDDGPGIPAEVMENMGEPFISIRKDSMGLGIFLANAAVQRLRGSIEMFNMKTGGAQTLISLPLPQQMSD